MKDEPAPQRIRPFEPAGHRYTQFDNYILDAIMPRLKPNAWKVLCFIIRKTRGWHKESDQLSYTQIQQGTGIGSSATVRNALKELIELQYVLATVEGDWVASSYRLNTTLEIEVPTLETEVEPTSKTEAVSTSETKDTKERERKGKENDRNAPPAQGKGKTVTDALHAINGAVPENERMSARQVRELVILLNEQGHTFQSTRQLWLSCKENGKRPVAMFVAAVRDGGEIYPSTQRQERTVEFKKPGHTWIEGSGWSFDYSSPYWKTEAGKADPYWNTSEGRERRLRIGEAI